MRINGGHSGIRPPTTRLSDGRIELSKEAERDLQKDFGAIRADLLKAAETFRQRRPWDDREVALINEVYGKVPAELIASKLHRSLYQIMTITRRTGSNNSRPGMMTIHVRQCPRCGAPGALVPKYRKCGKANCRCAKSKLNQHGPYWAVQHHPSKRKPVISHHITRRMLDVMTIGASEWCDLKKVKIGSHQ